MTLHEKLIKLREAVPYAQEDAQGYQYKYVSGTSLLAVLRPKMDELGVLLIPSTGEYTWTETIKENQKGEKSALFIVTLDMTMTWVNAEKPEEKIDVPFSAFGAQDDISKAFGSALTYSERYFLLKFFSIPTDKLDPDLFEKQNNPKPKSKTATTKQIESMFRAAKESGWSQEAAGKYIKDTKGVKSSKGLDGAEAEALTDYFKRTPCEKSDGPGINPSQNLTPGGEIDRPKEWEEFRDKWINLRGPGYSTYIFTPGNLDIIKAALERWPDLETEMTEKWVKLYPDAPWPLDLHQDTKPPGDNPEAWLPNDQLQAIFDKTGIPLKAGGDKIRQYMATQGRTGDEIEAQLERLGIYKSPEAWKVFSEKALF